ncbi:MAG: hypothetical protein J5I90_14080 [Caldilineales bacterium]|nr:hypothetical protein [Caldilineales bacterium]
MFPILVIAIGIAVLVLGKRLAILGAAVGALLGVGFLTLFDQPSTLIMVGLPLVLAIAGFFLAGFAKGMIEVIVLVIGAIGGAAVVLGFLNLFNLDWGLMNWILAVIGGVIGLVLIRRARKGSQDWGVIILSGLVGALLVTRGVNELFDNSLSSTISTIIVVVLAAASIVYQGELIGGKKTTD